MVVFAIDRDAEAQSGGRHDFERGGFCSGGLDDLNGNEGRRGLTSTGRGRQSSLPPPQLPGGQAAAARELGQTQAQALTPGEKGLHVLGILWGLHDEENGGSQSRRGEWASQNGYLQTAKAAGVHLIDYFKDVLLRISEPGVDAAGLTPHAWKKRFEPEVATRRHEILQRLVRRD